MPSQTGVGSFFSLTQGFRPGLIYFGPFDSAQGRLYGPLASRRFGLDPRPSVGGAGLQACIKAAFLVVGFSP